jgi:hypothetical protein
MGLCRDNATNYLAQLGYSVVRVPRENINPLDLVGRAEVGDARSVATRPGGSLPQVL